MANHKKIYMFHFTWINFESERQSGIVASCDYLQNSNLSKPHPPITLNSVERGESKLAVRGKRNFARQDFNNPTPKAAYICQLTVAALVEVMARLFGGKPIPKPKLPYWHLDPRNTILWNSNQDVKLFAVITVPCVASNHTAHSIYK